MQLCQAWLEEDPNLRITLPVHEDIFEPFDWPLRYGLSKDCLDRLELVCIPKRVLGNPHPRRISYSLGSALFRDLAPLGELAKYVDVVIGAGVFASNAAIRTGLQGTFSRGVSRVVPFVSQSFWTPTETWKHFIFNEFDAKAEMWGSLVCDWIYWESSYVKDDYVKNWKKYLNSSAVADLLLKSEIINNGVKCDRIPDKLYDGKDKPVAFWAGYPEEDYDPCCKALLEAHKAGAFSRTIIVFMGSNQGRIPPESEVNAIRDIEGVDVYTAMPQLEFLNLISEADIFIGQADFGTYGIRFGEYCAAAQLPVCSRRIAEVFLDSFDWTDVAGTKSWPFEVSSNSVGDWTVMLLAAAKFIRKNPSVCKLVKEKVLSEHEYRGEYLKMLNSVRDLVSRAIDDTDFGAVGEVIAKAVSDVDEISHADLVTKIQPMTETEMDLTRNALYPPAVVRWAVMSAGFEDVGSEEPYYRRCK
jgi:hypothetical protein